MPDLTGLSDALASDGLWLLVLATLVAGLVRGFSGFGTAMVYLPVAGQILSPFEALTTLIIMDLIGPWPNIPRALRDGHKRDILRLGIGLIVALPLGVYALSLVAPEVFRYGVSVISVLLLVLLMSGFRYPGRLGRRMIYGTGALGGFLAGSVGLPGPPVIMLYMASGRAAYVVRANLLMYLVLADIVMLAVLHSFGHLVTEAIWIGVILAIPYLLANIAGAAIFNPKREGAYRALAYVIIAASALSGLPLFD